jgi:hypothetical protein
MPNIKQMAHETASAGETRLENPVRERRVVIFSASRHCGRRRAHRKSQAQQTRAGQVCNHDRDSVSTSGEESPRAVRPLPSSNDVAECAHISNRISYAVETPRQLRLDSDGEVGRFAHMERDWRVESRKRESGRSKRRGADARLLN